MAATFGTQKARDNWRRAIHNLLFNGSKADAARKMRGGRITISATGKTLFAADGRRAAIPYYQAEAFEALAIWAAAKAPDIIHVPASKRKPKPQPKPKQATGQKGRVAGASKAKQQVSWDDVWGPDDDKPLEIFNK